jgi:hypothetical protein
LGKPTEMHKSTSFSLLRSLTLIRKSGANFDPTQNPRPQGLNTTLRHIENSICRTARLSWPRGSSRNGGTEVERTLCFSFVRSLVLKLGLLKLSSRICDSILLLSKLGFSGDLSIKALVGISRFLVRILSTGVSIRRCRWRGFSLETLNLLLGLCNVL